MSIRPLPDDVAAQIKSSTTITSLNGAVCGLIRNSLDAGATKITVSVDYIRGNCSVEDNGLGIPPAEFRPSGGLGKLHFTSKYPGRGDVHGKYGAFLASLASLSLFSITSHHHKYHSHNSIQIRNSDVLARHTPSPPDQRLLSFPHGTRATVRDLFGSMPVRVKQRAIDAERGLHSKHWELLKRDIVALVLAWNGPIYISGQEPSNRSAFSVRCGQMHQDGKVEDDDIAARVCTILYQAQLSDAYSLETWVPLRASAGQLSVVGAVSLHPIATKRNQFISIGICPVPNEHGSNVLYEEINRAFSNSSYGVEENTQNFGGDEQDEPGNDVHYKGDSFTGQELKGRKGTDRWPMFYIKIQVGQSTNSAAPQEVDGLFDERHGNLAAVLDILKVMVYEFLKKYHFRPKRIKKTREAMLNRSASPNLPQRSLSSKRESRATDAAAVREKRLVGDLATTQLDIHGDSRSRSRLESPFDFWTRIKSGSTQQPVFNRAIDKQLSGDSTEMPMTRTPDLNITPLFGSDGSLLRAPFDGPSSTVTSIGLNDQSAEAENGPSNEGISWTNPATKETTVVNPTTGFVTRPQPHYPSEECSKSDRIQPKRLRLSERPTPGDDRSAWFGELLSSWDNPIFKATEPLIPSAFREESSLGRPTQPFGCSTWLQGCSEVGPSTQGRVSKSALRNAEVIAQVDRKFIFARVIVDPYAYGSITPRSRESLLIIIDQHAADERCQVESLMSSYFEGTALRTPKACTEFLERPLRFEISVSDAAQFERMATHFAYWGIHYSVVPTSQSMDAGRKQIDVTKLPPSIAERCRLEPRLLIELLRKEAWTVDEHSRGNARAKPVDSGPGDGDATAPPWITRFHGCPEGILDMINSRACRSSIMFNDPLTLEECTDLLRRLADCAFPFQCAHGRPSMVPLVHIGDDKAVTFDEGKPDGSFTEAFKTWIANGSGKMNRG